MLGQVVMAMFPRQGHMFLTKTDRTVANYNIENGRHQINWLQGVTPYKFLIEVYYPQVGLADDKWSITGFCLEKSSIFYPENMPINPGESLQKSRYLSRSN